jgi:glycosyltransferase involved in cell wall biosynthesis
VSRKLLEQEDPGSYHSADKKTNELLHWLWDRPSVMIYSGPSWEKWDYRSLETTGIGGSEVWQVCLARELSKLGYRVTVFADTPETESFEGDVQWLHYTSYPKWADENWVNYAILSRSVDPLNFKLRADKVFVQIHDVWIMGDRYKCYPEKVSKFCALSQWHLDFSSDYHGISKDKMAMTANGIDFKRFDDIEVERNPYRLHWSSSWDRGLDNVLYLWPFIKAQVPKAELHVYYGCDNWKKSCHLKGDTEGLKEIAELEAAMTQPDIYNHGRKSQKELAIEIKKASLLLYPTWFTETYWITGVEAQYAGVPIIASNLAGIKTTIGDSGMLLGNGEMWWAYSKEGREQFLQETVSMLTDKDKWALWSDKGRQNSLKYSWENCALRWRELFQES